MTEEKYMHQLISDVFHITNESSMANTAVNRYGPTSATMMPKVFLYEFSEDGKSFKVEDLDLIICNRLMKNKDENKFTYLYEAYTRLENHLWAKRKQNEATVVDMKNIIARYFVTCLSCPDAFELPNDIFDVKDQDTKSNNTQS